MPIIAAAAAAFVVARWLTFLNRWEFLRFSFNDAFLAAAQVVTVITALLVMEEFSFTHLVVSIALADVAVTLAVFIDTLIVAASVWPTLPRRR